MHAPVRPQARPSMSTLGRPSSRAGFVFAALILAAVGGWVVWGAQRFTAEASWVAHTHRVLAQLEIVNGLRREVISAQRGYLLTRRDSDREDYATAKSRLSRETVRLGVLVRDNTPQAETVEQLAPLLDQRMAISDRTVLLFEARGQEEAQRFILTNGSQELDSRIDAIVEEAQKRESDLLNERRATSERAATGLLVAAILGIPLSLVILATIYRLLAKENAQRRRSQAEAGTANLELNRSISQLQRVSGDMAALSRYAGMLQGCTNIPELMQVTTQTLRAMLPESGGTVYLIKPSRDHAEITANWGVHRIDNETHPAPQDCWAVRRNQPFACPDVARDVHCTHIEAPASGAPVATHCLPLSAQGELMGWLTLDGAGPGPLRDAALAQQAAEQFALALANLRLKESLRQQSIRDPLTGLFNRRYLEESLAREIARCQRRNLPLVVMMLDLDHFKAFNDRHGHGGGDALLVAFARLLQANCREEDIPCRFGGEEFTLILPEADEALGVDRARALLQATAQLVVEHERETLSRVTASIGLACLPAHGNSATQLMAAADAALYLSKSGGRNRVTVAERKS